jgi:predicted RNA-binding Zn ribbon-like protein
MRETPRREGPGEDLPFRWLGGELCLDFANTVAWDVDERTGESVVIRGEYERLTHYSRLVQWASAAGTLSDAEANALLGAARQRSEEAEEALGRADSLRFAVHHLFSAIAGGRPVSPSDLDGLNAVLGEGLGRLRIVPDEDGISGTAWRWEWAAGDRVLARPLWPVAQSAASLLTSPTRQRVRECAGRGCGWLFLDTSRPGNRRWCTMSDCGNRAKARRHYQRKRAAAF